MLYSVSPKLLSIAVKICVLVAAATAVNVAVKAKAEPYEVAQRAAGSFIDSQGRRVWYDLETDRIIAVEPAPRRSTTDPSFPPAPSAPAARQNSYPPPPAARTYPEPVPAPERVERQPLDTPGNDDGPVIRRLEDYLDQRRATREPAAPAGEDYREVLPSDGEQTAVPAPTQPSDDVAPGESEPEVQSAAIPRTTFDLPKTGSHIAKLQILLDRKGFSPGVIDGVMGSNVRKALDAYRFSTGDTFDVGDEVAVEDQLDATGGPAFVDYTITPEDARGPYLSSVPIDYGEKAKLDELSYTKPSEMLAERFHMAEDYLVKMNPTVNFHQPGSVIRVAATGDNREATVTRIEADKDAEQVRAYDASGKLVAAYPATIGSTDTPSPSGTVTVERIAFDPEYTYNPKINFVQGNNTEILTIPPGPNGPVGSIWIALSKPTYGIHGTPQPDRIGKNNSHGCVRLTNWDATELAKMVEKGTVVQFVD